MNKEENNHTRNQKRMYRIHKQEERIQDLELLVGTLQQENTQLKRMLNIKEKFDKKEVPYEWEFKDMFDMREENAQLKQQLKDKDEKISDLIKLLIEMVFDDIDYLGVYQELVARHLVKLGYIVKEDGYYKELESNKED